MESPTWQRVALATELMKLQELEKRTDLNQLTGSHGQSLQNSDASNTQVSCLLFLFYYFIRFPFLYISLLSM